MLTWRGRSVWTRLYVYLYTYQRVFKRSCSSSVRSVDEHHFVRALDQGLSQQCGGSRRDVRPPLVDPSVSDNSHQLCQVQRCSVTTEASARNLSYVRVVTFLSKILQTNEHTKTWVSRFFMWHVHYVILEDWPPLSDWSICWLYLQMDPFCP